jgi:hypothetical protein
MYTQHGFRYINFYRFLTHDIHDLKIALIFYFFALNSYCENNNWCQEGIKNLKLTIFIFYTIFLRVCVAILKFYFIHKYIYIFLNRCGAINKVSKITGLISFRSSEAYQRSSNPRIQ